MTWFQMYLFTRLEIISISLGTACAVIPVMMCFTPIIIGMFDFNAIGSFDSKAEQKSRQRTKKAVVIEMILFTIAVILKILIPTQKEMAAIIVVPAIVNNEQIQQLGKNGLDLSVMATDYLKTVLADKTNKMETTEKAE